MVFYHLFIGKKIIMENLIFDLSEPRYSYMFGFMQADGHLTSESRGRGKMRIELSEKDAHILESFQKIIPANTSTTSRIRNTNFKKSATTVSLLVCNKDFRKTIIYYGIPAGKKSNIIKPSTSPYSEIDYWRGIIDADGSVGITAKNKPFISLITASEDLAKAFGVFIKKITGSGPSVNRNKRDNVFNITVTNERCQRLVGLLYYEGGLYLNRKKEQAERVLKWERPIDIKKRVDPVQMWTEDERKLLMQNTLADCYKLLKNRKKTSIKAMRDKMLRDNKMSGK